jgi:hypothetical protein
MPASSCVRPPNISATPNTTGNTPAEIVFALTMLSMNVVTANASNASGAELPQSRVVASGRVLSSSTSGGPVQGHEASRDRRNRLVGQQGEMNPEYVGVEASPDLVEKMRGHGAAASGTDAKPKVTIERARLWHIARYARGFWAPTIVALHAAAAAIAGVVVSLVSAMLAPGIVLGVIALVALTEFAKAVTNIAAAVRKR